MNRRQLIAGAAAAATVACVGPIDAFASVRPDGLDFARTVLSLSAEQKLEYTANMRALMIPSPALDALLSCIERIALREQGVEPWRLAVQAFHIELPPGS